MEFRSVDQISRVKDLMRLKIEDMSVDEINELCGHLIYRDIEKVKSFKPTSDANHAFEIMRNVEIVLSSHGMGFDYLTEERNPWYSSHAFLSDTSIESRDDIQVVLCKTAVKYLSKIIQSSPEWNLTH